MSKAEMYGRALGLLLECLTTALLWRYDYQTAAITLGLYILAPMHYIQRR